MTWSSPAMAIIKQDMFAPWVLDPIAKLINDKYFRLILKVTNRQNNKFKFTFGEPDREFFNVDSVEDSYVANPYGRDERNFAAKQGLEVQDPSFNHDEIISKLIQMKISTLPTKKV